MMRDLGSKVTKIIPALQTSSSTSTDNISPIVDQNCLEIGQCQSLPDLLMCSALEIFKYEECDDVEMGATLSCLKCTEFLGESLSESLGVFKISYKLLSNDTSDKKTSELFSKLKYSLKRHLMRPTHKRAVETSEERRVEKEKLMTRNEIVGERNAKLIHHSVYEARSYNSHERDITLLNSMIDVGDQHHSRKFAAEFVKTMAAIISTQLSTLIKTPLPCTGNRFRPVSLTGDKGTMKGLTMQPAGISTILLKHEHFKADFYVGTPLLTSFNAKGVALNMINSLSEINLSNADLLLCISGACLDGEYFLKNVPEAIADLLGLTGQPRANFLLRCIWDPAHRLEKADEHARKKGKIVTKCFDKVHNQNKYFRVGKQHISLIEEATEMNQKSRELKQRSETRFVAHQHAVLCNFFVNWPVQYQFWEKRAREMRKDKDQNLTSSDIIQAQNSARDLQSVEFLTVYLAMIEITDILTRASCQLQTTNSFPWEFVDVIEDLSKKLRYVQAAFSKGILPDTSGESPFNTSDYKLTKNNLGKQPWAVIKKHLPSSTNAEFQGIDLLCTGELENRPIRRYMKKKDSTPITIETEVSNALKDIAKNYLSPLLGYLNDYFITGNNPSHYNSALPEWIKLSRIAFNFCKDVDKRKTSFLKLVHQLIQPLTESECDVAVFQYNVLLGRALRLIKEDKNQGSLKSVLYRICTSSELYSGCELAIHVMLYNVSSISSECGMESLISVMGSYNTRNRPLSLKQLHSELMIRVNGPHPLHKSTPAFLRDALVRHFGGGPGTWNFSRSVLSGLSTSQVIARYVKNVPNSKLF